MKVLKENWLDADELSHGVEDAERHQAHGRGHPQLHVLRVEGHGEEHALRAAASRQADHEVVETSEHSLLPLRLNRTNTYMTSSHPGFTPSKHLENSPFP